MAMDSPAFLANEAMKRYLQKTNRTELIKFYKQLASMTSDPIPKQTILQHGEYVGLINANKLRRKNIAAIPKKKTPGIDLIIARICLATFLIERTNEIGNIALKKNKISLYSLFSSLRLHVTKFLHGNYYERSSSDIINEYIDLEPFVCACSELCSLKSMELTEIMETYKPKLIDEIGGNA